MIKMSVVTKEKGSTNLAKIFPNQRRGRKINDKDISRNGVKVTQLKWKLNNKKHFF